STCTVAALTSTASLRAPTSNLTLIVEVSLACKVMPLSLTGESPGLDSEGVTCGPERSQHVQALRCSRSRRKSGVDFRDDDFRAGNQRARRIGYGAVDCADALTEGWANRGEHGQSVPQQGEFSHWCSRLPTYPPK